MQVSLSQATEPRSQTIEMCPPPHGVSQAHQKLTLPTDVNPPNPQAPEFSFIGNWECAPWLIPHQCPLQHAQLPHLKLLL